MHPIPINPDMQLAGQVPGERLDVEPYVRS